MKVAICLRTKDFARFLPEWIAFHYALGVDEIFIYDDDSTDNTEEVLWPFVEAGIVRYIFEVIFDRMTQMKPLNHCLEQQLERRSRGDEDAATWVLFHDTDEYLYPSDTSLNIRDALEKHHRTCCALVSRVQYGSAGHDEMPRGLLLENFLMHSHPGPQFGNGLAKVMVNLDPSEPEVGVVEPPLRSMHNAEGCDCAGSKFGGVSDLRINHYLGSIGDYMDRTTRYWEAKKKGEMAAAKTVLRRDINNYRSDDIEHWACATREVLFRIVEGLDLEGGGERGGGGGKGEGEGEGEEGGVKAVSKLEP
ncbi:glycosyltransferase [Ectocarpus siliculosus]|uniref:Glycosyltransferase n=1 Tax=Ectocarpus siliculosus TaxID=2880 RepID=D7FYE9_ECTSI|nr:glycosyltransferase [Ectocarpus siliculosus]|eukprot:CBJ32491.1 glycosyltransferase [Ectocarpus siliculosus]